MRDIEILARFLAFRFFIDGYGGRMKNFIDSSFKSFNENWSSMQEPVQTALKDLEAAIADLPIAARLEIPHGPVAEIAAPGPQRLAVYQLTRPEAAERLNGRRDF